MFRKIALACCLVLCLAVSSWATVSVETSRVQYSCNGTTTSYTYPFKILDDTDLMVVRTSSVGVEAILTLNVDYVVLGAGSSSGNITLTSGSTCGSGYTLTMLRDVPLTQETDYVDGEAFSAESLESALDKNAIVQQQQKERLDRTPYLPKHSTIADLPLPIPSANALIGWNAGATGIENKTSVSVIGDSEIQYAATYKALAEAYGLPITGPGTYSLTASIAPTGHIDHVSDVIIQLGAYDIDMSGADFFAGNGGYQCFSINSTGRVTGLQWSTPNMFGAAGDGTTDDSDAVQYAVDAAYWTQFLNMDYRLGNIRISEYKGFIAGGPLTRILLNTGEYGFLYQPTVKTVPDLFHGFTIGTKEVPLVFFSYSGDGGGDAVRIMSDATNSVTPYHVNVNVSVYGTSGWAVYGGSSDDVTYPSYPGYCRLNVRADDTDGGVGGKWADEISISGPNGRAEILSSKSNPAIEIYQEGTGFHVDAVCVNNLGYDVDILQADKPNLAIRVEQTIAKTTVTDCIHGAPAAGKAISDLTIRDSVIVTTGAGAVTNAVNLTNASGGVITRVFPKNNYFEGMTNAYTGSGVVGFRKPINDAYASVTTIINGITPTSDYLTRIDAYKSSAAQTIGTASASKVTFDAENFDNQSEFATSTFTATLTGYYSISAQIGYTTTVDQKIYGISIYKGGSEVARNYLSSSGTANLYPSISRVLLLAAGDTIDIYAYHDAGVDQSIVNDTKDTWVSIHKLP